VLAIVPRAMTDRHNRSFVLHCRRGAPREPRLAFTRRLRVERLAISRSRLKPYHVLDVCETLADVVMGFDCERLFQDSPGLEERRPCPQHGQARITPSRGGSHSQLQRVESTALHRRSILSETERGQAESAASRPRLHSRRLHGKVPLLADNDPASPPSHLDTPTQTPRTSSLVTSPRDAGQERVT
jgi:hypothetical protein